MQCPDLCLSRVGQSKQHPRVGLQSGFSLRTNLLFHALVLSHHCPTLYCLLDFPPQMGDAPRLGKVRLQVRLVPAAQLLADVRL